MDNHVDRQAIVALVARLIAISQENNLRIRARADLDSEIANNNARMADCEAGLRALGHDLAQDGEWERVFNAYIADVHVYLTANQASPGDSDLIAPTMPISDTRPSQPNQSIAKLLVERLEEVGPKGSKAMPLREWLRNTHNLETHYKTVGMTLYRLSQDSPPKVHRKGHVWFFGPPPADAKDPGVDAPGLLEMMD